MLYDLTCASVENMRELTRAVFYTCAT